MAQHNVDGENANSAAWRKVDLGAWTEGTGIKGLQGKLSLRCPVLSASMDSCSSSPNTEIKHVEIGFEDIASTRRDAGKDALSDAQGRAKARVQSDLVSSCLEENQLGTLSCGNYSDQKSKIKVNVKPIPAAGKGALKYKSVFLLIQGGHTKCGFWRRKKQLTLFGKNLETFKRIIGEECGCQLLHYSSATRYDFLKQVIIYKPNILHLDGHGDQYGNFLMVKTGCKNSCDCELFMAQEMAEIWQYLPAELHLATLDFCCSSGMKGVLVDECPKNRIGIISIDGEIDSAVTREFFSKFYTRYLHDGKCDPPVALEHAREETPKAFAENEQAKAKEDVAKITYTETKEKT